MLFLGILELCITKETCLVKQNEGKINQHNQSKINNSK